MDPRSFRASVSRSLCGRERVLNYMLHSLSPKPARSLKPKHDKPPQFPPALPLARERARERERERENSEFGYASSCQGLGNPGNLIWAWAPASGLNCSEGFGFSGFKKHNPKGSYVYVLLWGILPSVRIVIPNMETVHSTISVHRTLWEWTCCAAGNKHGMGALRDSSRTSAIGRKGYCQTCPVSG